jgi:SagB-type dehydrogenase family enzyme
MFLRKIKSRPLMEKTLEQYRYFLKDSIRMETDFRITDQNRGIKPPPRQKPFDERAKIHDLVPKEDFINDFKIDLATAMDTRKSVRSYSEKHLTLKELSFLLWATQGVHEAVEPGATLRTVPSGGARHSFETYLYIRFVEGLDEGIYRYLPLEHRLLFEFSEDNLMRKVTAGALGQQFAGRCAATFIWSTLPGRMEWRYSLCAHKIIAIDAGHVCQNLYLACEAIGAATCAIGAYDQARIDRLLRLDGEKEFVIYMAPVGKKQ